MCSNSEEYAKKRKRRQEDMFLRRLFGILGKFAKADGKIEELEVRAAEKAFVKFPRASARRKYCVRIFNEAKDSRILLVKMASDFRTHYASFEDCVNLYEILWDIACAKGILNRAHKTFLKILCQSLKIPETFFDMEYASRRDVVREVDEKEWWEKKTEEWKAEEERRERERKRAEEEAQRNAEKEEWFRKHFYHSSGERPRAPSRSYSPLKAEYDLIGCTPDATDEIVKRAYRMASKKHHPDILRAKGCTEQEISAATDKMVQINAAWAKIKSSRGL